ncbi:MAG: hypothetical protein JWP69_1334 [Flaviaesturariibacter sp.]|nr:hypothetical protein [Flaviaesturariibacter sp.]
MTNQQYTEALDYLLSGLRNQNAMDVINDINARIRRGKTVNVNDSADLKAAKIKITSLVICFFANKQDLHWLLTIQNIINNSIANKTPLVFFITIAPFYIEVVQLFAFCHNLSEPT